MRIIIKIYAVLTAIIGFGSMLFFFPSPQGCSDTISCLMYSLCGLAMLTLGIGLFLLKNLARKCMLWFSSIFIGFFIYDTIWLLKNDFTGQGLIGMVLIFPMFFICILGLFLLFTSKGKKEFE